MRMRIRMSKNKNKNKNKNRNQMLAHQAQKGSGAWESLSLPLT